MSSTSVAAPRQPLALQLTSSSALAQGLLALGGAVALGLASQWEIPLYPVPISAQSLFVLLIGAGYGARLGGISMVLYLAMGAVGLPMFAGGASGAAHLAGPTAGYLFGFAVAAIVVGWLSQRGWDRTVQHAVVSFSLGTLIIIGMGVAGLMIGMGMDLPAAFAAGVAPFWQGFLIKVGMASLLLPLIWSSTQTLREE